MIHGLLGDDPAARWRFVTAPAICLLLAACDTLQSGFLEPAGPVAAADRHLLMIVACVLFFVAAPVLGMTPIMAWRFRQGRPNTDYRPTWTFSWVIEALIWLPPIGIVIALAVLVWIHTQQLDPYRPLPGSQHPFEVQVIGLDWKWLFLYPREHIATVNLLAIPAGRPVRLRITSVGVMQSFFVPRLAGQIYAMPGMTTQLNLAAYSAGQFAGENTQFNGKGFQKQHFRVMALEDKEFLQWVGQAQTSSTLDEAALARIRLPSGVERALTFSSAPPDLFEQTLHQSRGQQTLSAPHGGGMQP
jgi:cytochrome o ubiquinol oxidase subunit 2